jgi:hypothetical protein
MGKHICIFLRLAAYGFMFYCLDMLIYLCFHPQWKGYLYMNVAKLYDIFIT